MSKISSLLLVLLFGIGSTALVFADDGGLNPGYMTSVSTGTIVKSAYGECVHDANWNPSYGADTCGEAPMVTTMVRYSESNTQLFKFNTTTLSESGINTLSAFIRDLKKKGVVKKVTVAGYTDQIGADVYNERLSLERALAVKNFLVTQGLDGDTITADGMGPQASKVSAACFKKYGTAGLDQINALTAKDESNTPQQRQAMDAELAKFSAAHPQLINCAAADRRVEITLVQHKEVVTPAQ